jgi:hypothetical protein
MVYLVLSTFLMSNKSQAGLSRLSSKEPHLGMAESLAKSSP